MSVAAQDASGYALSMVIVSEARIPLEVLSGWCYTMLGVLLIWSPGTQHKIKSGKEGKFWLSLHRISGCFLVLFGVSQFYNHQTVPQQETRKISAAVIVARVNAHLGWRCVEKIAFRQGPLPPLKERRAIPPAPSEAAEAAARAAASSIEDDDLREAVVKLGARAIERSTRPRAAPRARAGKGD